MYGPAKSILRESCVSSLSSALAAQKGGADQIELCSRLDLDGLTPDFDLIAQVVNAVNIPVKIMIRPHAESFVYTLDDILQMCSSMARFKELDIRGFVFGALTDEHSLNLDQTIALIECARPYDITIHKCIDQCLDILESVDELNQLDVPLTILTSGGESSAIQGYNMINKMIQYSADHISIMAAGGITAANLDAHISMLNTKLFHGRRIV